MIKFDTIVLSDKEPERSDLWLKILQSDKVGEDGTTDMNISGLKLKYFSPRGWRSLLDWNTNMIYDFGYSKDTTEYTGDPITYSVSENKKTEHTDVVTNYWVYDGTRDLGEYDNIVLEKGLKTVLAYYVTHTELDNILEEYATLEDLENIEVDGGVSNVSLSVINDTNETWYGTNNTDNGIEVYLYALSLSESDEDALITFSYIDNLLWYGDYSEDTTDTIYYYELEDGIWVYRLNIWDASRIDDLIVDYDSEQLVTVNSLYNVISDYSYCLLDYYDWSDETTDAIYHYELENGIWVYYLNIWDASDIYDLSDDCDSEQLVTVNSLYNVISDYSDHLLRYGDWSEDTTDAIYYYDLEDGIRVYCLNIWDASDIYDLSDDCDSKQLVTVNSLFNVIKGYSDRLLWYGDYSEDTTEPIYEEELEKGISVYYLNIWDSSSIDDLIVDYDSEQLVTVNSLFNVIKGYSDRLLWYGDYSEDTTEPIYEEELEKGISVYYLNIWNASSIEDLSDDYDSEQLITVNSLYGVLHNIISRYNATTSQGNIYRLFESTEDSYYGYYGITIHDGAGYQINIYRGIYTYYSEYSNGEARGEYYDIDDLMESEEDRDRFVTTEGLWMVLENEVRPNIEDIEDYIETLEDQVSEIDSIKESIESIKDEIDSIYTMIEEIQTAISTN